MSFWKSIQSEIGAKAVPEHIERCAILPAKAQVDETSRRVCVSPNHGFLSGGIVTLEDCRS
jgi:hypothetical protein